MKNIIEYLTEAKSAAQSHEEIMFNILNKEYENKNQSVTKALIDDDEQFFKLIAKDYATFVSGCFGDSEVNKAIAAEAMKGVTKFKASIKLGIKK